MTELLRALRVVFEGAVVAGIGATLIVNGREWKGYTPDGTMPVVRNRKKAKKKTKNKQDESFTISTLDDSGIPHDYHPSHWPINMAKANSPIGIVTTDFVSHLLCPQPNCGGVYVIGDIDTNPKINPTCIRVKSVPFDQPASSRQSAEIVARSSHAEIELCGEPLFKTKTKSPGSARTTVPRLLYPTSQLASSIAKQLQDVGVEASCEQWRELYHIDPTDPSNTMKRRQTSIMGDVYDGNQWERYLYIDDRTNKPWEWNNKKAGPTAADLVHRVDCLAQPGTFALSINLDWFGANKDQCYSVGAIYATNLNLPRTVRNQPKNAILLGVLPGPSQTSRVQLQAALQHVVRDLNKSFTSMMHSDNGARISTADHPGGTPLRVILLCAICDTPAARKIGGMSGHMAAAGCPYCINAGTGKKEIGGEKGPRWSFRKTGPKAEWTPKTDLTHRTHAKEWCDADTVVEKQQIKWLFGTIPCALMDLTYFDMVRGIPLDVMHNIYLGLCKEMMVLLTRPSPRHAKPILSSGTSPACNTDLDFLQQWMTRCSPPSDISDIPVKIKSRFAKFKAAEWKNWATMFCVPAMMALMEYRKDKPHKLQLEHIALLLDVQQVALIMQDAIITREQVDEVDQLMGKIMNQVEQLFSKDPTADVDANVDMDAGVDVDADADMDDVDEDDDGEADADDPADVGDDPVDVSVRTHTPTEAVKPNIHYAQHLHSMLLDYGPAVGWSCYVYERFNGLLSNVPRNQSFIELCIMRRFILLQSVGGIVDAKVAAVRSMTPRSFAPQLLEYELISHMLSGSTQVVEKDDTIGLHESLRVTQNRRTSLVYQWRGEVRAREYRNLKAMRCGQLILQEEGKRRFKMITVTGAEKYPGRFVSIANVAHLEFAVSAGGDRIISPDYQPYQSFASCGLVMDCLRTMYANMYTDRIEEFARRDHVLLAGIDAADKKDQEIWRLKNTKGTIEDWRQFEKAKVLGMKTPAMIIYLTSRYSYAVPSEIIIYSAVEITGEIFGSATSPRRLRSSYVIINFHEQNTKRIQPYYAQVQFYFTHLYLGEVHHFAVVKYYDSKRQTNLGTSTFPIIKTSFLPAGGDDIVPIARLRQRFMPSIAPNQHEWMCAIPIPSKWHM